LRLAAAFSLAALALAGSLALGGCGTGGLEEAGSGSNVDNSAGKVLFIQKCGSCHTLREAGTKGTIGPNLDDAFATPRSEGFDQTTIYEVVRKQIDYAVEPMPQDLVEGAEADSVASYVMTVAANPEAKVSLPAGAGGNDPKLLFQSNCGSCHTLADAGTTGKVGPDLDQAKPTLQKAVTQITNGGGGMPPFKGTLTQRQIQALAQYVVRSTGG
jgi:cbb3-type cytochrome c oxidase subunit III